MSEIAGFPPVGGDALFHAAIESRKSLVAPAEKGSAGTGANAQFGSGGGGSQMPQKTPDALFAPMPKADANAHPGPPPAFQVSLLDLDAQLQDTLARLNADRARERDADAVAADVQTDAAEAENAVAETNDLLPQSIAAALDDGGTARSQDGDVAAELPV